MENETPKPEVKIETKHRSMWTILKGGFLGVDNEGSSKRLASFFMLTFVIAPLHYVFIWGFIYAVHYLPDDSKKALYLLGMFITILGIDIAYVAINSGLTSVEQITNLWKTIKGQNTDKDSK